MKFVAMVLPEGEAELLVESLPSRAWRFLFDIPAGGLSGVAPALHQSMAEADYAPKIETPLQRNARLAGVSDAG